MSRFTSFLKLMPFTAEEKVFFDLGSQVSKIQFENRGIKEPTALVFEERSQTILSIGKIADQQADVIGKGLSFIKPIKEGKVKDITLLSGYISQVLQKVRKQPQQGLMGKSVAAILATPSCQSAVQKQAFEQAFRQAHASLHQVVPSSQAAFTAAQQQNLASTTGCLIDLGAELTQVAIFINGELHQATVIPQGGKKLTTLLQLFIRNQYQCEVSWHTAERVKLELATLLITKKETLPHLVVRGRNVVSNTPQSVTLQAVELNPVLVAILQAWIAEIKVAISQMTGSRLSEILENGIVVYGGSSQLRGLVPLMEEELHCAVAVARHPQTLVIQGLAHVS